MPSVTHAFIQSWVRKNANMGKEKIDAESAEGLPFANMGNEKLIAKIAEGLPFANTGNSIRLGGYKNHKRT
jgi:hypothetical protein